VLLGECLHNDGATFLAKTRLVKFLHEKLGFNVLLWETSLYDMWYMNNHIMADNKYDTRLALYPFWRKSNETQELWNYINGQRDTPNPIIVDGFDLQPTGGMKNTVRANVLWNYLAKKGINEKDYPTFSCFASDLEKYFYFPHYKLRQTQEDSIVKDIKAITAKIKMVTLEDSIYFRYINGLGEWYNCVRKYKMGNQARFQLRDSIMATNLIWLIENRYPNSKVIVWAANMHVLYNNKMYGKVDEPLGFKSLGEYVKNKYKDDCYTIAFSSYCRRKGKSTFAEKGSNKGIEYLLHKKSFRYAFIDFQSINTNSFLRHEITLRANQEMDIKGKWAAMLDGLFYIDTMENATYPK